jgi:hypothetical protein
MKIIGSGKPLKGSKKPNAGTLYLYFFLFIIVAAAYGISGGSLPVNPIGLGIQPTNVPFYNHRGDDVKPEIILPTEPPNATAKDNLQLKTFKINTCINNVVVNFLVDTSGSFAYDGKMNNLKEALTAFTKRMSNSSGIGLQTFSANVIERVPLDYYGNQKIQAKEIIDKLSPGGNTRTRDGFLLAKKLIFEAKDAKKFKGYRYVMVLLTDGIPEQNPTQKRTCIGPQVYDPLTAPALRCFALEQDPRKPTNIANELKANNVSIFSIGIYSPNRPSDATFIPQLENLLIEVASYPSSDYYFSSVHGGDLNQILDKIFLSICQ